MELLIVAPPSSDATTYEGINIQRCPDTGKACRLHWRSYFGHGGDTEKTLSSQVLRVNRQLYSEGRLVLYGKNVFLISEDYCLVSCSEPRPFVPANFYFIRHIVINLDGYGGRLPIVDLLSPFNCTSLRSIMFLIRGRDDDWRQPHSYRLIRTDMSAILNEIHKGLQQIGVRLPYSYSNWFLILPTNVYFSAESLGN